MLQLSHQTVACHLPSRFLKEAHSSFACWHGAETLLCST